jgi:exopolyphosphatase / guanosine-5'-triphosphate,3'-diphosphate pyrophosphatase
VPRYAAIDIGSNSIRMEAAEWAPGQPARILASDREVTRLGEGVFRDGAVSEEALKTTCAVLTRMCALYRKLEVVGVRAVATSAIRDTRNQAAFLARASEAAGSPVEIISGREEARLIHLGVQSVWPETKGRTLILDIGGGSAEIIGSEDGRIIEAFSRPLGAVRLREIFLSSDPPSELQLRQMGEFIREKLDMPLRRLGGKPWDRAICTAASAAAAAAAVARLPGSKRETIDRVRVSRSEVRRLYRSLCEMSLARRRKVPGLNPRRAEIIVPGVAVLLAFLEEFDQRAYFYSRAGVRDGIIADLAQRNVGAEQSRLSREQRSEVERMARRYGVPLDHARKVAKAAALLFDALQPLHGLPPAAGRLLDAAAHLLNIGHFVSAISHHKHSCYIVTNSDMPGFTERERLLVAALCRYHRKALPQPSHSALQLLTAEERRSLLLLIPILRFADNLNRGRTQEFLRANCQVQGGSVVLHLHGDGDIDLGQWGAERAAEVFREIYGRPVSITRGSN